MTSIQVRDDPRMAGGVKRYHTWPVIQQQSNAEHMWNTVRIVYAIDPEPSPELLKRAHFHDVGEIKSGDAPYPVKKENLDLKVAHDRIEQEGWLTMVIPWRLPAPAIISPLEAWVLKMADMIEMWEFALQEVLLGNQFAKLIVERTYDYISKEVKNGLTQNEIPKYTLAQRASDYINRRKKTWSV